jgi:HPt (histidine-containing phosphotransfer) domain-containing protein
MEQRPVAHVYEAFRDYMPKFMANRTRDHAALLAALEAGDLARIAAIGHSLAGNCGTYGFHLMTQLGRDLEAAAEAGDRPALVAHIAELARQIDQTEIVYQA